MGRFAALGVDGVTLCDTTGMAYPTQVEKIGQEVRRLFPGLTTTMHFHNTRGMALANTLAAIAAGIDRFDASLGGLGGCPYAPGASGNVCTEDLVHMLELGWGCRHGRGPAGQSWGVSATLPALVGHDIPSQILKAGPRLTLHPAPDFGG